VLQSVLPGLAGDYEYVILDSPAGLEHVNRRVMSDVDDIFVVIDPSAKAVRNARNLAQIAGGIGISYRNLYLVGNYRFTTEAEDRIGGLDGCRYLGRIEADPQVAEFDWSGRSLLDLPADSPAVLSVAQVLRDAGYAAG
jgi:CO dehydrogenase maturation factor